MASVGVAIVNGVVRPGYLFAPGFVGDGSQLTGVHTSNVAFAKTGQLAYYTSPTTIGGDPSEVIINGDLYVSGNVVSSNTLVYENPLLIIGQDSPEAHTKGILISNMLMSYSNSVLTFGLTDSSATDIQLFHSENQDVQVDILGNLRAINFFGNASNLSNVFDSPQGVYGDGVTVPQLAIDSNGRPSVTLAPIQVTLENVTSFGNTTSNSIQFTNSDTSFVTSGKVGIGNQNPEYPLCVGDGVEITGQSIVVKGIVSAASFLGNASYLTTTCDANYGTYGDSLNTVQITVDKNGRLSQIDQIRIQSNLDTVTQNGSLSKSTIQLEHAPISMTTTGKVGIGNTKPDSLLCIGPSTRFNESDLFMSGNVSSMYFVGNAAQLTNTSDVKPGIYGGGAFVPQIWVNDKGRISDIQITQVFVTLDQVTQFNSSTTSTIYLRNKGTGIRSDGDLCLNNGKDVVILDTVGTPIGTFGQNSEIDSRVIYLSGSQTDSVLNVSNWETISLNSGITVDSSGRTTMKGCFMESGTGYILNAQQLTTVSDTLNLDTSDLFKWFSFQPKTDKSIRMPDPTSCQAGSWIGITNVSQIADIQIYDVFGTTLYTSIPKCIFICGNSCRLMCVSTLASANGTSVMGNVWVCS